MLGKLMLWKSCKVVEDGDVYWGSQYTDIHMAYDVHCDTRIVIRG